MWIYTFLRCSYYDHLMSSFTIPFGLFVLGRWQDKKVLLCHRGSFGSWQKLRWPWLKIETLRCMGCFMPHARHPQGRWYDTSMKRKAESLPRHHQQTWNEEAAAEEAIRWMSQLSSHRNPRGYMYEGQQMRSKWDYTGKDYCIPLYLSFGWGRMAGVG